MGISKNTREKLVTSCSEWEKKEKRKYGEDYKLTDQLYLKIAQLQFELGTLMSEVFRNGPPDPVWRDMIEEKGASIDMLIYETRLITERLASVAAHRAGPIKAAKAKQAENNNACRNALESVMMDLDGDCNPEWEHVDYFNWIMNKPKFKGLYEDRIRKEILKVFRSRGLDARVAKGASKHVKRVK
jgi:hypothetical protein